MSAFKYLVTSLAWLAAILFAASGVMLSYEVAARYFFTRPTIWAAELSQLCLIWGCLVGMPWVLAARRHIRINALTARLSRRAVIVCEVFTLTVVALFSAAVLYKGWHIFIDSYERGRTTGSLLDLPAWVAELAVPVGFALLLAQALVDTVSVLRHGPPPETGRPLE